MAVEAVKFARTFTDDVEFSPEDACRSEMPFLIEILAAVIEAGATTLNIPDTVGYVLPYEYGQIIATLKSEGAGHRQVHHQHALPQRPGHGGGELAGGRPQRGPAGRVHDQRPRRAGGQRRAGRGRHGDSHAGRLLCQGRPKTAVHEDQHEGDLPDQPAGLAADRLRDPAEQGDRRRQCLRPRVGRPRGRHAQGRKPRTRS